MSVLCCFPFHPFCGLTKYILVGTALIPALTVCMLAVGLGDSQALFSPGHWCRSTEVKSQDCSSCALGSAVEAMDAAQTLVWPNPHVYVPTKPTAAKARQVPAAGAPVFLSDVLQVLDLVRYH